jgi:hypothetical protein
MNIKKINWAIHGNKGKQSGIQYKDGDDPFEGAVGKSKGDELLHNILNPLYKDSIFETIINKYSLYRTRFMWVNPMSCYSLHKDSTPRIHIPLITNPSCYFIFKENNTSNGIMEHLPIGSIYWTNTTFPHTFINCSDRPRLHLVGIVKE